MANVPHRLTVAQLRAEAVAHHAVAAKNASHPETAASYKRLAERFEQLALHRENEQAVKRKRPAL